MFNGAGGGTSFSMAPNSWACVTSEGANWTTKAGFYSGGALYLAGTLTPTALSGNVNDYNPAGLAGAVALRSTAAAADRTLTGLAGGSGWPDRTLANTGATNNLNFSNADAASSAANRFSLSGNVTLPPSSPWRCAMTAPRMYGVHGAVHYTTQGSRQAPIPAPI